MEKRHLGPGVGVVVAARLSVWLASDSRRHCNATSKDLVCVYIQKDDFKDITTTNRGWAPGLACLMFRCALGLTRGVTVWPGAGLQSETYRGSCCGTRKLRSEDSR